MDWTDLVFPMLVCLFWVSTSLWALWRKVPCVRCGEKSKPKGMIRFGTKYLCWGSQLLNQS